MEGWTRWFLKSGFLSCEQLGERVPETGAGSYHDNGGRCARDVEVPLFLNSHPRVSREVCMKRLEVVPYPEPEARSETARLCFVSVVDWAREPPSRNCIHTSRGSSSHTSRPLLCLCSCSCARQVAQSQLTIGSQDNPCELCLHQPCELTVAVEAPCNSGSPPPVPSLHSTSHSTSHSTTDNTKFTPPSPFISVLTNCPQLLCLFSRPYSAINNFCFGFLSIHSSPHWHRSCIDW